MVNENIKSFLWGGLLGALLAFWVLFLTKIASAQQPNTVIDWRQNHLTAPRTVELLMPGAFKNRPEWYTFGVFSHSRQARVCEDNSHNGRMVIAIETFEISSQPIKFKKDYEFQDVPMCSRNLLKPTIGSCE